ncbi:zona pellucida sperm-binding protein 4-like isoform X2 [Pseudophryne corroboree]|uniref:zona pellucida sperm-binding protein 4-like isoform X2 n=1 Tax=Pseudophryne corroboree TaxID=495146 RepID=UPI00308150A8
MGSLRSGCGFMILVWSCVLQCDTQHLWDSSSHLHCNIGNMELSFPLSVKGVAFSISVLDFQGEPHSLDNNSACGFWVGQRLGDSGVISAAYDGCYVTEEDGDYVMTLLLEEIVNKTMKQYKVEKKCPVMPAMDAPSPSVCFAVVQADRLSCANGPVSGDLCEEVGCCYSATDSTMPCYYGNKLTTQCTSDNYMVVAVSKDLTVPSLILDSVSVVGLDSSCQGLLVTKSNSFVVFRFPLSCGGGSQGADGAMVYENTIEAVRSTVSWNGYSITRDSTMRVTVRCSFSQSGVVPIQVHVSTLPPPLPVTTSGPLSLEMTIAQDMDYTSYYSEGDYPVVRVLRDPVYLEVHLLHRTDPSLQLILNDCWATNSVDSTRSPQWPILLNSCPFNGDNYVTQLVPVQGPTASVLFPTHYKRFIISTFTFVDSTTKIPLNGLVYFHCSVSICVPSATENCMVSCNPRKRRMHKRHDLEPLKNMVTSNGPIKFIPIDKGLKLEGHLQSEYSTMDLVGAVAAAGAVACVTGIILAVWFHHKNLAAKSTM